ncbi:MAG TPA: hypothetical protein VKZ18_19600 [Polyangia bacterium]|nr:hypothetical protein [Polyangia bacterium]
MRFPMLLSILMAAAVGACGQSLTHEMTGTGGTGGPELGTGGSGTGGSPSCRGQLCGASCVDTTVDSNNCGLCGHACAAGQSCSNGSCVAQLLGCRMSEPAATSEIATFTVDGGIAPLFGLYSFGASPQPIYTVADSRVNITDTIQIGASSYYQGFGIYFDGEASGSDCLDASSYTGVSFSLSGSLTGAGCSMEFAILDSEHLQSMVDPRGAGPVGSYAPQLEIPSETLTATPVTIRVPFTGIGAPAGGSPPIPIDQHKLVGVQWWMSTPLVSDGEALECVWNINLSNVSFYN